MKTHTDVTADTLDRFAEFDHPFRVNDWDDASITDDLPGVYAPDVYEELDDDGQVIGETRIDSSAWEFVDGYSGQDRYSGPVMHASEFLGGRMAKDVLTTPGIYVVTAVTGIGGPEEGDENYSDEPIGWVLLRRDLEPPRLDHNDNGSWYCNDCKKVVILFDDDEHWCEATGTRTHFHDDESAEDE